MLKDINMIDLKLLSVFIPDYANYFSIREMVRKLDINYSHAFKRVKFLVKKKILIEKKGRHSSEISFNLNNLSAVKMLCFVEEQMSGELEFLKLNSIIKEISLIDSFACIGLFGSRASGKARDESDWDIFIITSLKKEIERWCRANASLYRTVQFQIFSLGEFLDRGL